MDFGFHQWRPHWVAADESTKWGTKGLSSGFESAGKAGGKR